MEIVHTSDYSAAKGNEVPILLGLKTLRQIEETSHKRSLTWYFHLCPEEANTKTQKSG